MAKISISWLKKMKKDMVVTPSWAGNGWVMFRRDVYFQNLLADDSFKLKANDDAKMSSIIEHIRHSPICAWHRTPYLYHAVNGIIYRVLTKDNVESIVNLHRENVAFLMEDVNQAFNSDIVWLGTRTGDFITDNINNPTVIVSGAKFDPEENI